MLTRFACDNYDRRGCVRMNCSIEHLNAVNGPHSQVGDNAYQTRVAVGKKIQCRFVGPCSIPTRGQQVRKRFQNPSVIINHGNGSNPRRWHFFLRVIEPNKDLALASGIERRLGDVSSCSLLACLTRVANESACIFLIIWPRCTCTVYSVIPSTAAACLLSRPLASNGKSPGPR